MRRRRAGHETLGQFALALRLVVARCLRRLGRLEESEYSFKILAGAWQACPGSHQYARSVCSMDELRLGHSRQHAAVAWCGGLLCRQRQL